MFKKERMPHRAENIGESHNPKVREMKISPKLEQKMKKGLRKEAKLQSHRRTLDLLLTIQLRTNPDALEPAATQLKARKCSHPKSRPENSLCVACQWLTSH